MAVERVNSQAVVHDHRVAREKQGVRQHHAAALRGVNQRPGGRWEIYPRVRRMRLTVENAAAAEIPAGGHAIQGNAKAASPQSFRRHAVKNRMQTLALFLGTRDLLGVGLVEERDEVIGIVTKIDLIDFLAKPKTVVDIMRLKNLDRIEEKAGLVVVGAAVRQASLMGWPALPERLPLVALALPWTGHVQTRSRGTICGSIAHADPSAEMPLALIALGGEVHLRSARSRRRIAARDFFTGMMTTERADDELIEAVSFPVTPGRHCAFREVARRHGDFAIVACAAVATRDGVRLAVGGVADAPVARDWPRLDGSALDDALNAFAYDLDARDDIHATARYRRDLVRLIGRDLVREVCL